MHVDVWLGRIEVSAENTREVVELDKWGFSGVFDNVRVYRLMNAVGLGESLVLEMTGYGDERKRGS